MEDVPEELQGYAAKQLRVRLNGTMYNGLENMPQDLGETVVPYAKIHLLGRDPSLKAAYPLEDGEVMELWYAPVYMTVIYKPEGWPYKWSGMPVPKRQKARIQVWPRNEL